MSGRPVVDVAVGVLIRPDGRFLLASRPEGKPYAHHWEFPGGKLEPGESVEHALARELHEELGIDIGPAQPWVVREFEYPHAHVRLHFCRVHSWSGELHGREAQLFRFCDLDDPPDGPLLPATLPVLRWLALPPVYAISNASEIGHDEFLQRLERQLERGVRLVQFREPLMESSQAAPLFQATLQQVRDAGGKLLVSSRHPREWAQLADGVHLTARDLRSSLRRPQGEWVGASAHNMADLQHASELGVDLAVFGPIAATASHPGDSGIGWQAFAAAVVRAGLPVYAVGGLVIGDLERAQQAGAHGIALQRAIWPAA
jgi:8-oxo-dGTP diphosphatase